VGATGSNDAFASFSNHGACVDLSAPGVGIASAGIGSATEAATMSGTSMAAPHAAGAAALYLAANPAATPAQVAAALLNGATVNALTGLPAGTTNALLGVAFLAGPPVAGPAVGALVNEASSACLEAAGGEVPRAVAVRACASGSAQQWTVPAVGAAGTITGIAGLCVDAYGGGATGGNVIGTWTCHGGSNQRWTYTAGGRIQSAGGLCVTAPGLGGVTTQPCDGSAAQRWTVSRATFAPAPAPAARYTAAVRNAVAGLCFDIHQALQAPGARAVLWSCNGGPNQQLSLPAPGTADEVRVFGLCVDAFGGAGRVGDVVGLWTCHRGANQQWTLTDAGELRGVNGLCVGPSSDASQNGAQLVVQTCTGSPSQRWSTAVLPAAASRGPAASAQSRAPDARRGS
jgi:hypothetical protein